MRYQILTKKISCLTAGVLIFWSPVLFMTSSKNPKTVLSHAALDTDGHETSLEREIRTIMEKGHSLEDRRAQIPVIAGAFARLTEPERARNLAALCYLKTLGTPFSPLDLAEIALVETGGHGLSSTAISSKGAIGVWQLMPKQARSHGYTPREMRNDEKCAEAAVRTLLSKLSIADGNLDKAKRLYCGVGPQAEAYLVKLQATRQVLQEEVSRSKAKMALSDQYSTI